MVDLGNTRRLDVFSIKDAEGCSQPEDATLPEHIGPSRCVSGSVYMLIRPGCVYLQHQREEGRFSPNKPGEKEVSRNNFADLWTFLMKFVCGEEPLIVFYWTQMSKEASTKASALISPSGF